MKGKAFFIIGLIIFHIFIVAIGIMFFICLMIGGFTSPWIGNTTFDLFFGFIKSYKYIILVILLLDIIIFIIGFLFKKNFNNKHKKESH